MDINSEYIELFTDIAQQIELPKIEGFCLPQSDNDYENTNQEHNKKDIVTIDKNLKKKDEFGVVILEDGSAGAFYTSLDDTLIQLENHLENIYSNIKDENQSTLSLIKKFNSHSLHERAIALGAINAVSQFIMDKAGYIPTNKNNTSTGIDQARQGERIGMIGYFSPLIKRLTKKGIEVLVLEKNPGRVELQAGVVLTENVKDLTSCQHILCTASTLINYTLDEVLSHSKQAKSFSLIGPSGSSLPDILFERGVNAIGGYHFTDIPALKLALANKESWGHAGNKYQLTPEDYPGVETLLNRIKNKAK
ncbi:hypothetical protein GCM10009133_18280 [Cocleimonas flava]|uniref:Uncharacterized protein (DUF4213/DUF364 family) n=1 Tax=Cocleimonas flava TaxID=634765 RepID=A0A4R1EXI8_9GAMM|nr:DUF364 domain-containing protein [Cocleimonas flava]TCJ84752.1 uncharacterized protein (DUF4213/DUF364 family) [Cocleimonas flava]